MSAIKYIQGVARKSLTKNQGSGITTIPGAMQSEAKAAEIVALLQRAGIPMNQLDDFIRSEADVLKFINIIENANKPRVIPATSAEGKAITEKLFGKKGEVVEFPQKRTFKEEIESMKKSGDIVDPNNLKKNDNVLTRELFQNSNLNKVALDRDRAIKAKARIKEKNKEPISEKFIDYTIQDINKKEPLEGMKIANKIIKREGEFKDLTEEQSKRILKETDDHLTGKDMDYDPEDFYSKGGRAGYYTGGITDVEPSLDDIGHGSDSLMARTRLMSPGAQATTSTGLNYLLAEDNDNMRIPFNNGLKVDAPNPRILELMLNEKMSYEDAVKEFEKRQKQQPYIDERMGTGPGPILEAAEGGRIGFAGGGDPKRRAFLKLLATLTGGAAAFKTGILGLGEGTAKKAVSETVKQAAGSGGQVPPYFLNLVKKIKNLGDETLATKDKAIAKKYKDYVMEEDFAGNITIMKKGDDVAGNKIEDVYMSLKVDEVPLKGKKGSAKVEEYEEFTARPDGEGKMKDVEPGVPDEVVQEGTMFEDTITEFGKADGGRIGFSAGNLAKLGITGSSRRFLEKVFGKEGFKNMIENDPEMHRGMLEVVEMFRKKDKEGLKMYMQKFLPHMDDATVEDFIIGGEGTEGIRGQLIRLGSGRDYQGKLEMMKKADEVKKLENFDIKNVTKNAEGGRIGLFLGGGLTAGKGLLKNMLKFMAKDGSHKKSPTEILKMMNPKQYEKLLNNPKYQGQVSSEAPEGLDKIIQDMIGKTKTERSDMVGDIISASRNIKKVDDDILKYKLTIIEDMVSKGIDREIAVEAAENISKEVAKSAGKKSNPKITEQGLLELENIQKNLVTKDRKLQATGGLTTMLGE